MELQGLQDYTVADISKEDVEEITQLEKTLSDNTHQDIVLVAYQSSKKAGV